MFTNTLLQSERHQTVITEVLWLSAVQTNALEDQKLLSSSDISGCWPYRKLITRLLAVRRAVHQFNEEQKGQSL